MALNIPASLTNSVVLSSFTFLVLTWLMFHYAAKKTLRSRWKFSLITAIILVSWFGLVHIFGRMGIFALNHLVAPYILIGFIVLFGILQKVYASQRIQKIADAIPMHWLIGIQFYRIVGVGFLILYQQGILPALFAFSAGFGDIIVGVSAPIVALLYYLKKPYANKLAIVWNIVGILDLIVALSVGFLGFPRPVQFVPLQPTTEPLSLFPLVVIPLFAVPLALLLHFLGLRVLKNN